MHHVWCEYPQFKTTKNWRNQIAKYVCDRHASLQLHSKLHHVCPGPSLDQYKNIYANLSHIPPYLADAWHVIQDLRFLPRSYENRARRGRGWQSHFFRISSEQMHISEIAIVVSRIQRYLTWLISSLTLWTNAQNSKIWIQLISSKWKVVLRGLALALRLNMSKCLFNMEVYILISSSGHHVESYPTTWVRGRWTVQDVGCIDMMN